MLSIAETRVEYNKNERNWEIWDASREYDDALLNGGVVAFPAGKEGKRGALLAALRNDRPDVAAETEAIIANNPDNEPLIDRTIRAGQLVAGGHVRAPLPVESPYSYNGECARVMSQSGDDVYAVSEHKLEMWCNCPDHTNGLKRQILPRDHPERPKHGAPWLGSPIGLACKHILAWLICCALADDAPTLEEMEIPF